MDYQGKITLYARPDGDPVAILHVTNSMQYEKLCPADALPKILALTRISQPSFDAAQACLKLESKPGIRRIAADLATAALPETRLIVHYRVHESAEEVIAACQAAGFTLDLVATTQSRWAKLRERLDWMIKQWIERLAPSNPDIHRS